jgi:diphthine synthase
MKTVSFIGLGLNDERGITLEGLEEAKRADAAFAEFYTNMMPGLDLSRLERLIGKKIRVLDRSQLEDERGRDLEESAQHGNVAFLVPGDPMVATTHVSLRLDLAKNGINTRIIHSSSITSAICGATGLQSYKFGRTTTVPYNPPLPASVLEAIRDNRGRGLHSLLLLDVRAGHGEQLTIPEALARILSADGDLKHLLVVGVARVGASDEKVKAGSLIRLTRENFGLPPQSIVIPGKLHFMEAEALKSLADAQDEDLEYSR